MQSIKSLSLSPNFIKAQLCNRCESFFVEFKQSMCIWAHGFLLSSMGSYQWLDQTPPPLLHQYSKWTLPRARLCLLQKEALREWKARTVLSMEWGDAWCTSGLLLLPSFNFRHAIRVTLIKKNVNRPYVTLFPRGAYPPFLPYPLPVT
jgi:hypothetical protein